MNTSIPVLLISLLNTLPLTAHAAPNDGITGLYARVEVGRANFDLSNGVPGQTLNQRGNAVKGFGGYRFNPNYGVEAGYAALGSFTTGTGAGGTSAMQDGKASSLFAAATGRLPLAEAFAVHGRLGVSHGKVSGADPAPGSSTVLGSKNSVLLGVGAEYRPKPNVALTLNYDSFGKLSNNVDASSLVFGLHFTF